MFFKNCCMGFESIPADFGLNTGQTVVFSSIRGCFDYSAVCCVSAACGYPSIKSEHLARLLQDCFELILDCVCSQKSLKMRSFQFTLWMAPQLKALKFAWGAAKESKTKYKSLTNIRYRTTGCRPDVLLFFFIDVSSTASSVNSPIFKWMRFTLHIKEIWGTFRVWISTDE